MEGCVEAMAMAVAVGASVDASSGVCGGGEFVRGRGLRQGRGFGPAVSGFVFSGGNMSFGEWGFDRMGGVRHG